MRPSGRENQQLRNVKFTRDYTKHAKGSVLVEFGETKVLCTATVNEGVPRFLKGKQQGWLTAEYSMLPSATHSRTDREAARGKQGGRTLEIQRLIGRALRSVVDLKKIGERTIILDCDVLQADGGTRTASITGAFVALADAINKLQREKILQEDPIQHAIAAISVGIYRNQAVLDLDYAEDCNAETDMNVVMTDQGQFIEVQGTAEGQAFSMTELNSMLELAQSGIQTLIGLQKETLEWV